ncbi:MAG: hydrogenase maturation protease [Bacteroidales bacterium]
MTDQPKIFIYGYGNPGRQDDGLGNLFVEKISQWVQQEDLKNFKFDSNYQLNIEDAAEIAGFDIVIFVDASVEDIQDVVLDEITPKTKVEFSMHSVSASYVVQLCNDIYKESPRAYLLHIKGYEWEFREGVTARAAQNLEKAIEFMKPLLKAPEKLLKGEL